MDQFSYQPEWDAIIADDALSPRGASDGTPRNEPRIEDAPPSPTPPLKTSFSPAPAALGGFSPPVICTRADYEDWWDRAMMESDDEDEDEDRFWKRLVGTTPADLVGEAMAVPVEVAFSAEEQEGIVPPLASNATEFALHDDDSVEGDQDDSGRHTDVSDLEDAYVFDPSMWCEALRSEEKPATKAEQIDMLATAMADAAIERIEEMDQVVPDWPDAQPSKNEDAESSMVGEGGALMMSPAQMTPSGTPTGNMTPRDGMTPLRAGASPPTEQITEEGLSARLQEPRRSVTAQRLSTGRRSSLRHRDSVARRQSIADAVEKRKSLANVAGGSIQEKTYARTVEKAADMLEIADDVKDEDAEERLKETVEVLNEAHKLHKSRLEEAAKAVRFNPAASEFKMPTPTTSSPQDVVSRMKAAMAEAARRRRPDASTSARLQHSNKMGFGQGPVWTPGQSKSLDVTDFRDREWNRLQRQTGFTPPGQRATSGYTPPAQRQPHGYPSAWHPDAAYDVAQSSYPGYQQQQQQWATPHSVPNSWGGPVQSSRAASHHLPHSWGGAAQSAPYLAAQQSHMMQEHGYEASHYGGMYNAY